MALGLYFIQMKYSAVVSVPLPSFPSSSPFFLLLLPSPSSSFLIITIISYGEGNGNLLQYSCLENLMNREAWKAVVLGVASNQT